MGKNNSIVENPFVFGKVVRGEHFCNRESEIAQLCELVRSKQHVVLISPRRFGKTSLVINALEKNKIPYVYVDCTLVDGEKGLMEAVLNDYANKLDNIALLEKIMKKLDFSFSISINPVSVSVTGVKADSLKGVLSQVGKNYVLVFDEFQDVYEKEKNLANSLRSVIQFLDKSVIMLGSKRHVLDKMFLTPRGIFYNFGYALHLQKIGESAFKKFIARWFSKSGLKISEGEISELLAIAENHPFFTQYLCHFVFEKRRASKASVKEVLAQILEMNSAFYEETFNSLPLTQKKALLILSRGGTQVYSGPLLKKYALTSQTLQKALALLMKKEIVDKNASYHILDVFFRHWLYQKVLYQKV
ncbi:ATP-binding protein [Candidatus Micrarchaeota archaeon]|nr:ATP-binding protein [Candidatus Micrarchaeota archaeon]